MPVEEITSGITLYVSHADELQDAYNTLSNTAGGGRIELTQDAQGLHLDLRGGGDEPVHITSEDPSNPVALGVIKLTEVDNLRISNVDVDSTGTEFEAANGGFGIYDCEAVELSGITFTGGATDYYDPDDPDSELGIGLGSIRESTDVVFNDNTASGYYHGVTILETREVNFSENTFTQLQGDGLRMGGVQDVLIEDNHFHDFLGTAHGFNHNDMIQLWSTNAEIVSSDITITGNILDSGEGSSSQSIWIRNETYDQGRDDSYIYENITITNNLIHNSHVHGIAVGHADGVTVEDNTLLWNAAEGDPPRITLSSSWNVTANNNITAQLSVPEGAEADGNVILNYTDPHDDDYVSNHIVNPFATGDVDLSDLRLRPDSEYLGSGAQATDPMLTSSGGVEAVVVSTVDPEDPQTVFLDAGFSVDETGFLTEPEYRFEWEFPDGSIQEGATLTHHFTNVGETVVELRISHNGDVVAEEDFGLVVQDDTFLSLSAEHGFDDQSAYSSELWVSGAEVVDTPEGSAFRIGGTDYFAASDENAQLHGLQSFELSLNMSILDQSEGTFLRMGSTMTGEVDWDGSVWFRLRTDEGTFRVESGGVSIDDGAFHDIAITYSNADGTLQLQIDGEVVDEVDAQGTTPADASNSLIIGSPWNQVVDALISDVSFAAHDTHDASDQDPDTDTDPDPDMDVVIDEGVDLDEPPALVDEPNPDAYDVTNADIIALDVDKGLTNLVGDGADMWGQGAEIVDGPDGAAVRIGDGDIFGFSGRSEDLHNLDSFGFRIDMNVLDESDGTFLRMGSTMTAEVDWDGSVWFRLRTDEGTFRVDSGDVRVDDGEFHEIGITYSDDDGVLQLQIDGEVVDEVDAHGSTTSSTSNSLIIGSPWDQVVDALVRDVGFTSDAADLGLTPSGGPQADDELDEDPTADEQEETPDQEVPSIKGSAEGEDDLIACLFLPLSDKDKEADFPSSDDEELETADALF